MAKDEEKKAGGDEEEKKGFPIWIIVLVGSQVLLVAAAVVAYQMFSSGGDGTEAQLKDRANPADAGDSSKMVGPTYNLDTFIVNLLSDGLGTRYLKVDIVFELENSALNNELGKRLPQIRDEMLSLLSSRRMTDIETADGKRILRDDIFTRVNKILVTGRIKRVYFTDFVIQ